MEEKSAVKHPFGLFLGFLLLSLFISALTACSEMGKNFAIPTISPDQTQHLNSTLDLSTPAPPADEWTTFTYPATGLSFRYPANWFVWLDQANNRAVVMNAPPGSVATLKRPFPEFIRIDIALEPVDIKTHVSLQAYIDAAIVDPLPSENFVSQEELPDLPQGYAAIRLTTLGLGENMVLFVTTGDKLITLSTSYVPGKKTQMAFLYILDQIAETLTIP